MFKLMAIVHISQFSYDITTTWGNDTIKNQSELVTTSQLLLILE